MAHRIRKARLGIGLSAIAIATATACGDDDESPRRVPDASPATDAGTGEASEMDATGRGGAERNAASRGGSGGQPAADAAPESGASPTDGGGECSDGCECAMDEMCDYTCAKDCTVECLGGRCTADCPEGGCTFDADFGATASYTCNGGDCETDCDNESECSVDCSGGGCIVGCDADSRCSQSSSVAQAGRGVVAPAAPLSSVNTPSDKEQRALAQRQANALARARGEPLPYPNIWDASSDQDRRARHSRGLARNRCGLSCPMATEGEVTIGDFVGFLRWFDQEGIPSSSSGDGQSG